MASHKENKDFVSNLLPNYLLDDAIEWIKTNLEPEDVFSEERLSSWAIDMGYIKSDDD